MADAGRDGGPMHPIRCGNDFCSAPAQFCCIPEGNAAPRCVVTGGQCPDTADRVSCDDRTDCPDAAQICCAADIPNGSSVASCRLPVNCTNQGQGNQQQLCDPLQPMTCLGGIGMFNPCRADNNSVIPDYPYCH
jgi:hypothetical protein